MAKGKNVIFVMIESFHAFPRGMRVEGQEITPVLNDLARRSLNFTNFYGQTWEGTTSDGEFTSRQSLHPLASGSVATTYPYHSFRGLPDALVVMRSGGFVLGDTVCATRSAEIAREECRTLTRNAEVPVERLAPRFAEAPKRLETSYLIITGDLIPGR